MQQVDNQIEKAQSRLSTQRWQFFARLGSMLWVVVDTVLSAMGRGLPGRRRSMDPALRSVVTERGQQSNAKITLESALHEKDRLAAQHQLELSVLESSLSPAGLQIDRIDVKPLKSDIDVDEVSLVWLPWRVSPTGTAEPVY
jgi:hypothetical protein